MAFKETRGSVLASEGRLPPERVALVDLLDRLLAGGVVVSGDLVLSIADIDLVRISIRAVVASIRESEPLRVLEPVRRPGREDEPVRGHGAPPIQGYAERVGEDEPEE
ncbi:gas vesicle protein [Nonomuraea sp. NPDC005501]|uniref:gas vesicle protein n=1 Tax=Nonomuraea sp. NPDC005501 TaxID=3156884 RepID=UPI0033BCD6B3